MRKRKRIADSGYFSNNPELRGKTKIGRFWVPTWIIVLCVAGVVLGIAAKPAYRAFREYRIDQNLAAAQAAAQAGDWATARSKARNVLLARRGDMEASRIWTEALCEQGDRSASSAAISLFSDPRATREDRLKTLRVLALQAPQALAMRAYASLPAELRLDSSFRAAITPLLIRQGEFEVAEKQLREVAQPHDAPEVRLELLRVLVSRPNVGRVAEAREIFASLIADKADESALATLLLLGDVPGGLVAGAPLPALTTWLDGQTQASARHHLLGMQPTLETAPESAESLYQLAIKRFLATEPGVLGTWLASNGQSGLAIKILEEPAQTRPDAFFSRLRILMDLRQETTAEEALAAPPAGADPVEIELARAALATSLGQPDKAESALTDALNLAASDSSRNRFIEIAELAEKSGSTEAAEKAWVAAVRLGWGPLPLYRDLRPTVNSLTSKGRSEDLLAMTQSLLRFEPNDLELQLDFNYLSLIHNSVAPSAVTEVVTKLRKRLDSPRCHTTLMLASLLDGHPEEALASLNKAQDGATDTPMMLTALTGTARVLTGETEQGTRLLSEVDWNQLMPQESNILRGLLVKFKLSQIPIPEVTVSQPEIDPEKVPAWRKAVEQAEKNRANDNLPALPMPKISSPAPDPGEPTQDLRQP